MNFFDKNIETMPRDEIISLQKAKLEKRFGIKDIKYAPLTSKTDLRENYPTGLFGVDMKKVVRLHASSGTTGKPTVVGYTKNDLDMWSDCMARLCVSAGVTDEDIVQIAFGYGLFTGALGLHYGLEKIGAIVIPASSGNTDKQIMLMEDIGTTGLVSTPSYAYHLGERIKELDASEKINLKLGLLGSEGSTVEFREKIEEILSNSKINFFATDNYGMSELMGPGVSGDCSLRCGMHINEDHFLAEILDPITLEPKPEGEYGELVITTLSKECMPLVRYRTKDITCIWTEKCSCGRTHARMDKIKGRTDDMLKIRGVNVFPGQIESVLCQFEELSPNYQLVVTRENFSDKLEVKVEFIDTSLLESYRLLEELKSRILKKIMTVLGIKVKVSLVESGSIERTAGKAKRILDLRE
ncbi:MAG: phenylacetate--CoA ligase [Ruminococcus sp.]|jgi:phenylacetate-CoA ligase|nr:phenylacetate--CoA ligase [Ruminococcus sp.]